MINRPVEPPDPGWCKSCHAPCEGTWQDEGIGAFEYFGSKGYDCQWVAVSDCCGSAILDLDPTPYCENCGDRSALLDIGGFCPSCSNQEEENEEANQNTEGARLSGQEPEIKPMPSGEARWNFTGSRLSSH